MEKMLAEILSWHGYDVTDLFDKVDEDFVGEVKIWKEVYYYANTITNDIPRYLTDNNGNQLVFDSYKEAYEYLKKEGMVDYDYCILSNGEYSAPDYWIVEA